LMLPSRPGDAPDITPIRIIESFVFDTFVNEARQGRIRATRLPSRPAWID
jgi:hypothetical protein